MGQMSLDPTNSLFEDTMQETGFKFTCRKDVAMTLMAS